MANCNSPSCTCSDFMKNGKVTCCKHTIFTIFYVWNREYWTNRQLHKCFHDATSPIPFSFRQPLDAPGKGQVYCWYLEKQLILATESSVAIP